MSSGTLRVSTELHSLCDVAVSPLNVEPLRTALFAAIDRYDKKMNAQMTTAPNHQTSAAPLVLPVSSSRAQSIDSAPPTIPMRHPFLHVANCRHVQEAVITVPPPGHIKLTEIPLPPPREESLGEWTTYNAVSFRIKDTSYCNVGQNQESLKRRYPEYWNNDEKAEDGMALEHDCVHEQTGSTTACPVRKAKKLKGILKAANTRNNESAFKRQVHFTGLPKSPEKSNTMKKKRNKGYFTQHMEMIRNLHGSPRLRHSSFVPKEYSVRETVKRGRSDGSTTLNNKELIGNSSHESSERCSASSTPNGSSRGRDSERRERSNESKSNDRSGSNGRSKSTERSSQSVSSRVGSSRETEMERRERADDSARNENEIGSRARNSESATRRGGSTDRRDWRVVERRGQTDDSRKTKGQKPMEKAMVDGKAEMTSQSVQPSRRYPIQRSARRNLFGTSSKNNAISIAELKRRQSVRSSREPRSPKKDNTSKKSIPKKRLIEAVSHRRTDARTPQGYSDRTIHDYTKADKNVYSPPSKKSCLPEENKSTAEITKETDAGNSREQQTVIIIHPQEPESTPGDKDVHVEETATNVTDEATQSAHNPIAIETDVSAEEKEVDSKEGIEKIGQTRKQAVNPLMNLLKKLSKQISTDGNVGHGTGDGDAPQVVLGDYMILNITKQIKEYQKSKKRFSQSADKITKRAGDVPGKGSSPQANPAADTTETRPVHTTSFADSSEVPDSIDPLNTTWSDLHEPIPSLNSPQDAASNSDHDYLEVVKENIVRKQQCRIKEEEQVQPVVSPAVQMVAEDMSSPIVQENENSDETGEGRPPKIEPEEEEVEEPTVFTVLPDISGPAAPVRQATPPVPIHDPEPVDVKPPKKEIKQEEEDDPEVSPAVPVVSPSISVVSNEKSPAVADEDPDVKVEVDVVILRAKIVSKSKEEPQEQAEVEPVASIADPGLSNDFPLSIDTSPFALDNPQGPEPMVLYAEGDLAIAAEVSIGDTYDSIAEPKVSNAEPDISTAEPDLSITEPGASIAEPEVPIIAPVALDETISNDLEVSNTSVNDELLDSSNDSSLAQNDQTKTVEHEPSVAISDRSIAAEVAIRGREVSIAPQSSNALPERSIVVTRPRRPTSRPRMLPLNWFYETSSDDDDEHAVPTSQGKVEEKPKVEQKSNVQENRKPKEEPAQEIGPMSVSASRPVLAPVPMPVSVVPVPVPMRVHVPIPPQLPQEVSAKPSASIFKLKKCWEANYQKNSS